MSERERFEKWLLSGDWEPQHLTQNSESGAYDDHYIETLWDGFQARAELAAERERELEIRIERLRDALFEPQSIAAQRQRFVELEESLAKHKEQSDE